MQPDQLVDFVRHDYARVLAALTFACGDRARAEDALQEALVTASQHRGHIGHPRAWVTKVALNRARTSARRLGAEQRANERAARLRGMPADTSGDLLEEPVIEELRRLPTRQREIVVLHYLLDMAVADVAAALGVTTGTVKTQLHRARTTLRDRLAAVQMTEEESDHVG